MQPLPPLCGPCRRHAAPATNMRPTAAVMRPLPQSCGPCRRHVASCQRHAAPCRHHEAPCCHHAAPCRHHAAPCRYHAAPCHIMWALPSSCGPCHHHAAPCNHHAAPCHHHAALAPIRPLWLDCWSATSSSAASAPAPLLSLPRLSLGGPCSSPDPPPSAVVNPPLSWAKSTRGLAI